MKNSHSQNTILHFTQITCYIWMLKKEIHPFWQPGNCSLIDTNIKFHFKHLFNWVFCPSFLTWIIGFIENVFFQYNCNFSKIEIYRTLKLMNGFSFWKQIQKLWMLRIPFIFVFKARQSIFQCEIYVSISPSRQYFRI